MRPFALVSTVLLAALALAPPGAAQTVPNLKFSLFERYLESLRQQVGIPGLSAAIVQDRAIVWEGAFGAEDLESARTTTPRTPYVVADLTATVSATLLMQCVERGTLSLNEAIRKWTPLIPEPGATVGQVLVHISEPPGLFKYNPSRYAALTHVVEGCAEQPYRKLLAQTILDGLGMSDSVPGHDLANPLAPARALFDEEKLQQYGAVLARVATPYKVDKRGRAARSEYVPNGINAAVGLVTTVRDLARYDAALDNFNLLRADTVALTRTNVTVGGAPLPMGLGWFVQRHEGLAVVWHFGLLADAYSSLVVKIPERNVTLILLANSDGLSAPFPLAEGDVTSSLFARLFLRLFA